MMRHLFFISVLAMGVAQAAERPEIDGYIHDYLMNNPEILAQALNNMQKHFENKQAARTGDVIADNRTALYHNSNDFSLGRADAPITIVEFFDYNCGYCKRAFNDLLRVVRENGDVRLVFKEYPILSETSRLAAEVALTLPNTQTFLQYHTKLMNNPSRLNESVISDALKSVGSKLDAARASSKMGNVQKHLSDTRELGVALGADGTPTFIINDAIYKGALSYDELRTAVYEARAKLN